LAGVLRKCFGYFFTCLFLAGCGHAASYQYFRLGSKADLQTTPQAGFALMGGGSDIDDAFRWLCEKANGGDFLVLRATGDDDYNPYLNGLCKLNSVATIVIPDRDSAQDPAVADYIRHAEAVFISGGDQARYVHFWQGTPVEDALNAHIAGGKPIGGTSAGLAILGEFSYGALNDPPDDSSLGSAEALRDPFFGRITLVRDFLKVSLLQNTITDSHFTKRDRLGRSLVFLARLIQDGWSQHPREIAIDEKSAVLVEPDGKSRVVGAGKGAYFIRPTAAPSVCEKNVPLTFQNIAVYKAPSGGHFDLSSWTGDGGSSYSLSVERGTIQSTQPGNEMY
jgi:cyanophycinase